MIAQNNVQFEEESKYNAGLQKIFRIHEAKQDMHKARLVRDFRAWLNCLMTIRSELLERMEDAHYDKCTQFEYEINSLVDRSVRRNDKTINFGWQIMKKISEYERLLSQIEKKLGMGMPMKRDRRGL